MTRKRALYMFISTTIVLVYLVCYHALIRPTKVNAQVCYQLTLEKCSNCTPSCPGVMGSIVITGWTPGVYGVPIYTGLCKEI